MRVRTLRRVKCLFHPTFPIYFVYSEIMDIQFRSKNILRLVYFYTVLIRAIMHPIRRVLLPFLGAAQSRLGLLKL